MPDLAAGRIVRRPASMPIAQVVAATSANVDVSGPVWPPGLAMISPTLLPGLLRANLAVCRTE